MSILPHDNCYDLNKIYHLLLSLNAEITSELSELNPICSVKDCGYLYDQYSPTFQTRMIVINKFIPIPIEYIIMYLILPRKYSKNILKLPDNFEVITELMGYNVAKIYLSSCNYKSLIQCNFNAESIFGAVFKLCYSHKGFSPHNLDISVKLWIDIIKQYFLTDYMNKFKLQSIMKYEYGVEYKYPDHPDIFDLTQINAIKIYNNVADTFFSKSESYGPLSEKIIYNMNVSIRISQQDNVIRIIPNKFLEDESVLDDKHQPKLENITICGINHIYRYVENVFKLKISTEDEKRDVSAKFGIKYESYRDEAIYNQIIGKLNLI